MNAFIIEDVAENGGEKHLSLLNEPQEANIRVYFYYLEANYFTIL